VAEDASVNSEYNEPIFFGLYAVLMLVFSLALTEMKLLLREVYSRFTTHPDPTMTDELMAMSDQLISSRPLGARCLLRFSPLENTG
jgi:hypothetical protein